MNIRADLCSVSVVVLTLVPVAVATAAAGDDRPWDAKRSYVFAQNAHGFRFEGTTLVLEDVASTLYVADRPQRHFGHMSNRDFTKLWNQAPDSFAANAPHAVLSLLGEGAGEIVLGLTNPRVRGTTITYGATVMSGAPPAKGGACALFIDPSRGAPAKRTTTTTTEKPINERDRKARETIATFKRKDAGLQRFFEACEGYAVFPTIAKGALIVGGARGDGVVYRRGELIGYATVTQGTIGLQIGGQAYSELIFFEDEAALMHFTNGNLEFSGQASAVAATEGASADASYADGVLVFTMAQGGLMLEASIGGQGFSFDEK